MRINQKIIYVAIFLLLPFVMSAATPAEALEKAKSKLSAAKSLSADYSMSIGGQKISGKLVSKGSKFSLTSSLSSSWYDGSSLWTYNASSKETTVMKPDASELRETNPLLYINSASGFTVAGSKQSKAGCVAVALIPKKSGTGVKNVLMFINSTTFLPVSIEITPSSGSKIVLNISNVKLNPSVSDSQFTYPKSKYPKAKIVDLR